MNNVLAYQEWTDSAMYRLWPNWYIQLIGVYQIFVDNGQQVTHQTRIKIKLSLHLRNTCNSLNVNQCNIHRSPQNRLDTKKRIKTNHTCKLRNLCNSIMFTDGINPLKIETEWNIVKWIHIQVKGNITEIY